MPAALLKAGQLALSFARKAGSSLAKQGLQKAGGSITDFLTKDREPTQQQQDSSSVSFPWGFPVFPTVGLNPSFVFSIVAVVFIAGMVFFVLWQGLSQNAPLPDAVL